MSTNTTKATMEAAEVAVGVFCKTPEPLMARVTGQYLEEVGR